MSQVPTAGEVGGAFVFAVLVLVFLWSARWLIVNVWSRGHFVYEIDLADGTLWYIGECADLKARMRRHESFQARLPEGHPRKWWEIIDPKVRETHTPTRFTWYPSKAQAKLIERQRVREKSPPGNQIKYKGVVSGGE